MFLRNCVLGLCVSVMDGLPCYLTTIFGSVRSNNCIQAQRTRHSERSIRTEYGLLL